MAHLYQLLLLCGFLLASVSVARRLGCDRRQAGTVGMLIASNPVTLAMAATCTPDVMAMMFGMAGMDRLLLFRQERRWGVGLASGLLLAAAVLCRASTAPLLLVAALLLPMPAPWKRAAECLWPLGVAAAVVVLCLGLNRGPSANATVGAAFQALTSMRNVPRNLVAFLCYQALTGPLLVYALLTRGRKFAGAVAALVALGVAGSTIAGATGGPANLVLYAVPAALGICFILALVGVVGDSRSEPAAGQSEPQPPESVKEPLRLRVDRRKRLSHPGVPGLACLVGQALSPVNRFLRGFSGRGLPLVVWLSAGLVALPYVYMGAKYLLPGVPAAALLIVLHAARVRQRRYPLAIALVLALGWISGALIVVGDTTLASSQRAAVDRLIAPRIHRGRSGRAASGPFWPTPRRRVPRRWPIRRRCPAPATLSWSAAWTITECCSACPSASTCSTREPTGAAACSCSTAVWAPGSIPTASGICRSPSGAGKSTPTISTAYCLDILIH